MYTMSCLHILPKAPWSLTTYPALSVSNSWICDKIIMHGYVHVPSNPHSSLRISVKSSLLAHAGTPLMLKIIKLMILSAEQDTRSENVTTCWSYTSDSTIQLSYKPWIEARRSSSNHAQRAVDLNQLAKLINKVSIKSFQYLGIKREPWHWNIFWSTMDIKMLASCICF